MFHPSVRPSPKKVYNPKFAEKGLQFSLRFFFFQANSGRAGKAKYEGRPHSGPCRDPLLFVPFDEARRQRLPSKVALELSLFLKGPRK